MRGLARRLVADAATADDLVQDTWVLALQRGERPGRGWFATALRKLTSTGARSGARRRAREERVARPEAATTDRERPRAGRSERPPRGEPARPRRALPHRPRPAVLRGALPGGDRSPDPGSDRNGSQPVEARDRPPAGPPGARTGEWTQRMDRSAGPTGSRLGPGRAHPVARGGDRDLQCARRRDPRLAPAVPTPDRRGRNLGGHQSPRPRTERPRRSRGRPPSRRAPHGDGALGGDLARWRGVGRDRGPGVVPGPARPGPRRRPPAGSPGRLRRVHHPGAHHPSVGNDGRRGSDRREPVGPPGARMGDVVPLGPRSPGLPPRIPGSPVPVRAFGPERSRSHRGGGADSRPGLR